MIKKCNGNEVLLARHEQQAFGFDHGEIAGALLQSWQLPQKLVSAITHHHQAHDDPASAVLYLAELVANAVSTRQEPETFVATHAQHDFWSVLELNRKKFSLNKLGHQVTVEKMAVMGAFFGH